MDSTKLERLHTSARWIQFIESTALGLQLNLAILEAGIVQQFHAPKICPYCNTPFTDLSINEIKTAYQVSGDCNTCQEFETDNGNDAVAFPLPNKICVIARGCSCNEKMALPLTCERAKIAQKLLTSFQFALGEGLDNGQRAIELSTLRRMNHIVISLFRGDGQALERAFDLVLSALIILLDAKGSWLVCQSNDKLYTLIKGDKEPVNTYLKNGNGYGDVVTTKINNSSISGEIGVAFPSDKEEASSLLPLLAEEFLIVCEIDNLFKLLQNQLTRVLGAIRSAILLTDQNGNITYANKSFEELINKHALSLLGTPASDYDGPWTPHLISKPHKNIKRQMEVYKPETNPRWLDWEISPLLDNGKIVGWITIIDDRTNYHRWQEAGRQAERFATTATMVGALAHELRNPITVARGMLQLIGRQRKPEKVAGYSDLIIRELDRVNRLLNEFLLLGKPAEMEPEPLEILTLLEELIPLIEGEAVFKDVQIKTEFGHVSSISADPGQLTQVILNMLRNAVEAVDPGGHVLLGLSGNDNWINLSIQDNGPGISPQAMENMFRPFYTTKERGTGLGLPTCQAIIHNHGGRIIADNSPSGGAIFNILLPTLTTECKGEVTSVDAIIAITNEMIRYPIEQALRTAGYHTISSVNLPSALSGADRYCPKVLIVESASLKTISEQDIKSVWPKIRLLVIQSNDSPEENGILSIPRPINYSKLVAEFENIIDKKENGF
ncbi:MAG: PAS domain-containing protein [Firmicutes bacterium]|nr:PAS domain-containing protein [Bacillota bacterium]